MDFASFSQDFLSRHVDAYSFIFNGNSQALDHSFVSVELLDAEYDVVHAVIDAPESLDVITSDHDPAIARISVDKRKKNKGKGNGKGKSKGKDKD